MKEKRQETIHKYFKSPGKKETAPRKSSSSDESKELMPEAKGDRPIKKQLSSSLGKQDTKKALLSSKKVVPSKKNVEVRKYENSGKKVTPTQQKVEKSPKKRFSQKPSPAKKTPKNFSPDPGVRSAQKQQLAKKVKNKYKDAGNVKKRDATKNLLEKHKMSKTALLKEEMNDRFVFTKTVFQYNINCDISIIILPVPFPVMHYYIKNAQDVQCSEADTSVSIVPHILIIFLQCVCIANLGLLDHMKCMYAVNLE
jgi:hypothetical protein